jgi:hypothetical protein
MVRFQKLKYFSPYTGTTIHCQQWELSKFLMWNQQFASHAYCRVVGAVSKMASEQEKAVCSVSRCPDLWLQCSVSFMHRLKKMHHKRMSFFKLCTKLTLHCNHRSGHLKTEHTESLLLLWRHLGNWSRSKHEKRTAGSACKLGTISTAGSVCCACVWWEINFLPFWNRTILLCIPCIY